MTRREQPAPKRGVNTPPAGRTAPPARRDGAWARLVRDRKLPLPRRPEWSALMGLGNFLLLGYIAHEVYLYQHPGTTWRDDAGLLFFLLAVLLVMLLSCRAMLRGRPKGAISGPSRGRGPLRPEGDAA
ncbi:MAG: hypothetical protein ABII00_16680 [Elusimicrobiota bacterium]